MEYFEKYLSLINSILSFPKPSIISSIKIKANVHSVITVAAGRITESDLMYGAFTFSLVSRLIESKGLAKVEIGLKYVVTMIFSPLVIPASIPPAWFEVLFILPFWRMNGSWYWFPGKLTSSRPIKHL